MRGERACLLLLLLSGCVSEFEDAHSVTQREADELVRTAPFPDQTPEVRVAEPSRVETRPDGRRVIRPDIHETLRLAVRNNQRYLVEGENLQVLLPALEELRHGWEPSLSPLTGAVNFTSSPDAPHGLNENATFSLSPKLPFGGTASAAWTHTGTQAPAPRAYSGTGALSLNPPLLRGAGNGLAMEELVSAERLYVYAGRSRDFNLIQLHVGVVESYFGLLQRDQAIHNFERDLERAKRRALQDHIQESFGKVLCTDVYRSQLQVTRAESDLSAQREQLKTARDPFKIDLGIPLENDRELAPQKIEYRPIALTQEAAVKAAPVDPIVAL